MRLSHLNSGSQGAFDTPAVAKPLNECVLLHADGPSPLRDRQRLAVKRDPRIASSVAVLLVHGRPSAIRRRVTGVVLDSIQRKAVRPLSHIGQKVFKGQPPLANRDASSAVVGVIPVVRIKAPLFHSRPRFVGRRLSVRSCVAVPRFVLAPLAVTGLRVAVLDLRDDSLPVLSAKVTPKEPLHVPLEAHCVVEKSQRAESFSDFDKGAFSHSRHPRIIAHMGYLCYSNGQPERSFNKLETVYLGAGGQL